MKIDLRGERVSLISFSYQFNLHTDDGSDIQIETPFEFLVSNARRLVVPGEFTDDDGQALVGLLFDEIRDALVVDDRLRVRFASGRAIIVPTRLGGESWNISTPRKSPRFVVMGPDGTLDAID